MNNKKGISLIVLVITILVMIILAGVVIVSLQNDNPINKAKYAKMVDSVQSVRGAISQYAVTKQAQDVTNGKTALDAILDAPGGKYAAIDTYTKILKPGSDVKAELGVDPSPLQGQTVGYFAVNPDTGASVYKLLSDTYDTDIKANNPDGIKASK